MKNPFTNLIENAKPNMPDPAPYRRINRLHFVSFSPRNARFIWSSSPGFAVACLLVFIFLTSYPASLESDDWQLETLTTISATGDTTHSYDDHQTGFFLAAPYSPEEALEFQQDFAARDAEPCEISCLACGGMEFWSVYGIRDKEGKKETMAMDIRGILPKEEWPGIMHFLSTYYRDMRIRSKLMPATATSHRVVFGVEFEVRSWTHSYPGYGPITYSFGIPREMES